MKTLTVHPHEIETLVRQAVLQRTRRGKERAQTAVDDAIQVCYEEGEIYLAAALLEVTAGRVDGDIHGVLGALLQRHADRLGERTKGGE